MTNLLRTILVAAVALGIAAAGLAYPNFNGTTGIIAVPNALIAPGGSVTVPPAAVHVRTFAAMAQFGAPVPPGGVAPFVLVTAP